MLACPGRSKGQSFTPSQIEQCKEPADFVHRIVERWFTGAPKSAMEMDTQQSKLESMMVFWDQCTVLSHVCGHVDGKRQPRIPA